MIIASSLCISLILCLLLTPVAKSMALRFKILDVSNSSLKTHVRHTPYLGGLSIFASVLITCALLIFWVNMTISIAVYGLLTACFIIVATGFVDDLYTLRPQTKMFLQLIAAALVWLTGTRMTLTGFEPFDIFLTMIWIVGLSNAFNLIDIMDGLASGVAAISSVFLSVISMEQGELMYGVLLLSIAGACWGFLTFNFNPAQIFMGDTGSLFLGFIIACAAIPLFQNKEYNQALLAVTILGVPIFETIYLSILRIKSGILPWMGTKDHFALRLVRLGLSVKRTVIVTYLFCALQGGVTLAFFFLHSPVFYWFLGVTCLFTLIGWLLSKVDNRDSQQA